MEKETDIAIIRIRQFYRERGLTMMGYAKMIGTTDTTIKRLFDDGFNPTLSTLRKMESIIPKGYRVHVEGNE